jgi:type I restriction enzyme M protein
MITGEIKQKVDAVWQTFWNGGFTAPITILEQMTYIFFMKLLDDKQLKEESNANLFGTKLANPTFGEGLWHNPESDKDVPYYNMRWHVFQGLRSR